LIFLISRKIAELGTSIYQGSKGIDLQASVEEPLPKFLNVVGDSVANAVADQVVESFAKLPNTKIS